MATSKREYSTDDAAPVVLYALQSSSSDKAFPVTSGMFSNGLRIPEHDTQTVYEKTDGTLTTIVYTLSSSTVATKTITVVGTKTTISISYV